MAVKSEKSSAVAQDFVQFALDAGVLRFGEFKTKAGRMSPYFFNSGLFDDGGKIAAWPDSMQTASSKAASNST
jgi:orotate phosphoribosyltransferase